MARTHAKDTFIPYAPTHDATFYPETDGKPMAASDYHRRLLMWTLQALEAHFAQKTEVYISGDILMYYKQGDPRKSIAPDVLVCFGINPKLRRTYKIWEEGKAPDFVMEFSSESTYHKDLGEKMEIYASLDIQDYFLYDAEGLYLPSPLMGFTLVNGNYVAISPDEHGGLRSAVLDLDFRLQGAEIRIYDPIANEWVQTLAERETTRAETAEARAETAEARAETAEVEAAQLREELARLKAGS